VEWLLGAFVLAGLVAMIAAAKGRSGVTPRTAAQAEAEIAAKLRQDGVIRHPGDKLPLG
jgi:hypothetical protein